MKASYNPKSLRSETTLMPWLIWFIAVLFYAYEFTQRVSLNIYWPYLSKDFLATATAIGLMNSCFYWAYALMQLPSGILIDKLGTKKLMTLGVFIVSMGSLYFSYINTIEHAALARLIIGAGSAVAFICAMKLIIVWFPPYKFALVAGLTNLMGYLGASIGQVPLNVAVNYIGWRDTSWWLSMVGLVITILVFLYIRDKPYKTHKISKKPARVQPPSIFHGLHKIIHLPMNWANGFYAMLMMGPTSAFGALWGKSFFTTADHFNGNIAAGAITAIYIGVASGSPFFGWLSEHLQKRQRLLIIAALGASISTATLIYCNNLDKVLVYILCYLFGAFQSAMVLNFAISKSINAKKNSGASIGFTNMLAVLGGAWLQPIIGLLLGFTSEHHLHHYAIFTGHSYHIALSLIPASQFSAFIIASLFLSDKKQDQLTQKAHAIQTGK